MKTTVNSSKLIMQSVWNTFLDNKNSLERKYEALNYFLAQHSLAHGYYSDVQPYRIAYIKNVCQG